MSGTTEVIPSVLVRSIVCKQGAVRAVRFNVDGNYCITCGSDKSVKLWNPHKGFALKTYSGHGYEVLDAQGSCDSSQIVSCGMDKTVILWDVSTGQPIRKFRGHMATVNAVRFNEESTIAISGSVDGSLRCWDCRTKQNSPIQIMEEAKDSITSIQTSDHEILSGSGDGKVRRYDVRNGQLMTDEMGQSVSCVNFTRDGQGLVVSCLNNSVYLMDKDTGEMLQEYVGHANKDYRIESCLNHTDTHVMSGSEDGHVYIWSLVHGNVIAKILHPESRVVHSLTPHPTEMCLITAAQSKIFVWRDHLPEDEEDTGS